MRGVGGVTVRIKAFFIMVLAALLVVGVACREANGTNSVPSSSPSTGDVMVLPGGGVAPGGVDAPGGRLESVGGFSAGQSTGGFSYVTAPDGSGQQSGLWVSGAGVATAAPDIAQLQVGVEVQDATVAAAQRRAREAMNAISKVLKDSGIADKDIRTTSFNIYQVTRWLDRTQTEEVIGYRVSHLFAVTVRDVDKVGGVIDAVADAGGDVTRIHGISFSVADPTPYLNAAREKAMQDAIAKARQMAQLAGVSLGKPVYIAEGSSYSQPQPMYALKAAAEASAPTPISAGENQFSVTVQMVFAIE